MTDWFRSWHGAPTDPKWVLIGRKAGIAPALASAIAWALFDHASQASPRGSVEGFDCEVYAAWGGLEDAAVSACVAAMTDRGMIVNGKLANWAKRQPEREDGSAERAKAWRERKRTQANALERKRPTDTDTEENTPIPPNGGNEGEGNAWFEKWFGAFPKDPASSPVEAREAFDELETFEQMALGVNADRIAEHVKSQKLTRPHNPAKFLRGRKFEGLIARPALAAAALFKVSERSPQGRAWEAAWRAEKGKGPPWKDGFWRFPTEWPPGMTQAAE